MLSVGKDQYGWFVECVSCGYMRDSKEVKAVGEHIVNSHNHIEKEMSSAEPNNNSRRMF